jgi:nucleotide-binding universal stress UspA family protein
MPHPLGVLLSLGFIVVLGSTLLWMLRLPRPLAQEVARAVYSVEAARCIVVPVLDLYYSHRAVELACRLGLRQGATIVLAYLVEVPRLLTLDSPLPAEVQARADKALADVRHIVERHGLKPVTDLVRAREAGEGVRRTVEAFRGDVVVLGVEAAPQKVPGVFTRTADTLLRHPPCEVIIDSVPVPA